MPFALSQLCRSEGEYEGGDMFLKPTLTPHYKSWQLLENYIQ